MFVEYKGNANVKVPNKMFSRQSPDDNQIRENCASIRPPRELYPLLQPTDGMIMELGPRPEGHSVAFPAIQTHFSRYFHRAIDFLGLRRGGFWA